MRFEQTSLWRSTLGPQDGDSEHEAEARERLRAELRKCRLHAEAMAGEIARALPEFTDHGIAHLDALWEMAEIVSGDCRLTPTEGFVFGVAALIHDIAMSLAAYPGGEAELRADPRFDDAVVLTLRSDLGRAPTDAEVADPPHGVLVQVRGELLRERHAEQAAKVPTQEYGEPPLPFISDPDLRRNYGELIGQLAASHWWDTHELPREFSTEHAPSGTMPAGWGVDPLKLACLIRTADAAHLDVRRAPLFLRAIRQIGHASDQHWKFQQRLQQPRLEGDRVVFTSTQAFPPEDAEAWWLALDAVRVLDKELKAVDAILADARRPRLSGRSVAGVDDPARFSRFVPVRDWLPVDATLHVGNVTELIRRLGGAELYGQDPHVPLRELIANAGDAVTARSAIIRSLGQSEEPGHVTVSLTQEGSSFVLEVADNGIGMDQSTMAEALLNFGTSYWDTYAARQKLAGLWAGGFEPTGHYGIGFFSVFMLGEQVRVISRPYDAAAGDTNVLEFASGLGSRPLLRQARPDERSLAGGTRVRVTLAVDPRAPGGLLSRSLGQSRGLGELCRWLAPTFEVTIRATEAGVTSTVVGGGDWRTIAPTELLDRLSPGSHSTVDDNVAHLRAVVTPAGETVARLALVSRSASRGTREGRPDAPITVGGLRSRTTFASMVGVALGKATRAARDEAVPTFDRNLLADWATEQAALLKDHYPEPDEAELAQLILECGGDPGDLVVAESVDGWLSVPQLVDFAVGRDEITLLQDAALSNFQFGRSVVELLPGVLVLSVTRRSVISTPRERGLATSADTKWGRTWGPRFHDEFSVKGRVASRICRAWGFDSETGLIALDRISAEQDAWEDEHHDAEDAGTRPWLLPVATDEGGLVHLAADRISIALLAGIEAEQSTAL